MNEICSNVNFWYFETFHLFSVLKERNAWHRFKTIFRNCLFYNWNIFKKPSSYLINSFQTKREKIKATIIHFRKYSYPSLTHTLSLSLPLPSLSLPVYPSLFPFLSLSLSYPLLISLSFFLSLSLSFVIVSKCCIFQDWVNRKTECPPRWVNTFLNSES